MLSLAQGAVSTIPRCTGDGQCSNSVLNQENLRDLASSWFFRWKEHTCISEAFFSDSCLCSTVSIPQETL